MSVVTALAQSLLTKERARSGEIGYRRKCRWLLESWCHSAGRGWRSGATTMVWMRVRIGGWLCARCVTVMSGQRVFDMMMMSIGLVMLSGSGMQHQRERNLPVLCRSATQRLWSCLLRCLRQCSGRDPPRRPLGPNFRQCALFAGVGGRRNRTPGKLRWSQPCVPWGWRTSGWVCVVWARCRTRLLEGRATYRHKLCQRSWKRRVGVCFPASAPPCRRRRAVGRSRRAWSRASPALRLGWLVCAWGWRPVASVQRRLPSSSRVGATGRAVPTATECAAVWKLRIVRIARQALGASVENMRLGRCGP